MRYYVGKVTSREITALMLQTLPNFYSYLANLARLAIKTLIDQSPFTDIIKTDTFKVNIGDYIASTEPIYTESKNKDANKLAEWFADRLENEYTFEDFSHLDFSHQNFTFTEFRYSHFRHTNLSHTNLQGCALIGANFHHANLEHCTLDNCSIYETDFSYAK